MIRRMRGESAMRSMRSLVWALLVVLIPVLGGCAAGSTVQGLIGFVDIDDDALQLEVDGDEVLDGGGASMPTLGAAVQLPGVGRGAVTAGWEWGGTVSFESDFGTVSTGNGGLLVVSDNDYLLVDVFGGAYVNAALGEAWRLYGGAGPLFQYGSVDLEYIDESDELIDVGGDGFGLGVYARAGIERLVDSTHFGVGVRWVSSTIEPGSGIEELEIEGWQFLITATQAL